MVADPKALPRHLVTVWNPSYGTDVMESHIRILRDLAAKTPERDDDEIYVWWGKIKSQRRQAPLPHLDEILALNSELGKDGEEVQREMQMYMTDYRSLYVAHIAEITREDITSVAEERKHIPAMYLTPGVACDCWFMLWDIRRLISDDTLAVVEELKKLNNVGYYDQPVSIYGGMVNLPLIVTRSDGARYFDHEVRQQLNGGRHWVQFDAEYSGIGTTERELRQNSFGEDLWSKLDPATRTFVATAEKLYRDHRDDMSFDFSPVILGLAKAFEVQTNIVLKQVARALKPSDRSVSIDGRSVDLAHCRPLTLGSLARVIGEERHINDAVKQRVASPGNQWFAASLPAILNDLATLRNASAHSDRADRKTVGKKRDQYLGVGCEGELIKLAKVTVKQ